MTSVPRTQFIYDRQGNVVNVVPAGSSADVVAMSFVQPVTAKLENERKIDSVPYQYIQNLGLDSKNTYDLETFKITTAHPIITKGTQAQK